MSATPNPVRETGEQLIESLLQELGPAPSSKSAKDGNLHLTFGEIGYGFRAGRSLGISILAHLLAIPLVLLFAHAAIRQPRITLKRSQIDFKHSAGVLTLPVVGGGREGSGELGGGSGKHTELSSGLRARSRRGFVYPGPQPMVSNPPGGNLGMQTILQPSLKNLPQLKQYVEMPNLIQPAEVAKESKPAPLVVRPETKLRAKASPAVSAPRMHLPSTADSEIANLVESKPNLPQRAIPESVQVSELTRDRTKQKGLLVLNAVPPPPDVKGSLPRAEARSIFAVSPAEAAVIAEPAAGTKFGGRGDSETGSGSRTDMSRGDAVAEVAAGGNGTDQNSHGSGVGQGGRYGDAEGRGVSSAGNSAGSGRGNASGPGLGSGVGASTASGEGTGSGPGTGGFRGITVQGGRYGNGASGNVGAKVERRGSMSYNMTIVSAGNSGGGLPDVGVFQNEKVYTVYLDMRSNDEDSSPSWILQYAVLQAKAEGSGEGAKRIHGTITPPYATFKVVPEFAPEFLRKCAHRLIIASAVMDTTGKLAQVSLMQSPESRITAELVDALQHWMFEPAHIDGQPVELKVLLGIRLAVPR